MPNIDETTNVLSKTQLQQFIRDGFVRIDQAFAPEMAAEARATLA